MLTYTFSRREKALLVVLAAFLLFILWYQLVFVQVNDQIDALNGQIGSTQDQIVVAQAKTAELATMRKTIDGYQAEGRTKTTIPAYDNTTPLMQALYATLGRATNFSLEADDLDGSTEGMVKRGFTLTFTCDSYQTARGILNELSQGAYPCSVESVSITDNAATAAAQSAGIVGVGPLGGSAAENIEATAHLTFYERGTLPAAPEDEQ